VQLRVLVKVFLVPERGLAQDANVEFLVQRHLSTRCLLLESLWLTDRANTKHHYLYVLNR
jgi:hypothetical protein